MEGTIYDILVNDGEYTNKAGKKCISWKPVGVAFDPKDGGPGLNLQPFKNTGILGPCIVRPRQEKPAKAETPEGADDGADFLTER